MAGSKRGDICGAVKFSSSGVELVCLKPKHVKLRLVQPGDTARDFLNEQIPHAFQTRYPYRNKEN
jgi:hypothetical protein